MGKIYQPIIYQIAAKIPNGRKIGLMAIRYTCIVHYIQDPRNFTQIGIFGLKIFHVATLFVFVDVHFNKATL
jgi:hypothetical protein